VPLARRNISPTQQLALSRQQLDIKHISTLAVYLQQRDALFRFAVEQRNAFLPLLLGSPLPAQGLTSCR
jgi:hypothetical protein